MFGGLACTTRLIMLVGSLGFAVPFSFQNIHQINIIPGSGILDYVSLLETGYTYQFHLSKSMAAAFIFGYAE